MPPLKFIFVIIFDYLGKLQFYIIIISLYILKSNDYCGFIREKQEKIKIKKIFIAMCLITMTAATAACGNDNAASSSSSSAGSSGVQQTVLNERATEKGTEATESSTKATEKGTEKATEKKSETGSSKSDKDKKSKSSKSDKDKKSSSSKSDKDKKSSSSKNSSSNNNNSNNGGGEITYYYTTTTTGGSTGGNSGSNSSAPNQNSNSGSNGSSKNNNSGSTGKSNNSSSSQSDPHAGKTWHEAEYKVINHPAKTEKVWVVDQPATTKEEPVYETHGVTICNVCGADITNAAYREQHLIAHIEAGEGGSYHDEWREIQVGTKTVTVPEKGHWEEKIVKPAWTEKKLVREAGWY